MHHDLSIAEFLYELFKSYERLAREQLADNVLDAYQSTRGVRPGTVKTLVSALLLGGVEKDYLPALAAELGVEEINPQEVARARYVYHLSLAFITYTSF